MTPERDARCVVCGARGRAVEVIYLRQSACGDGQHEAVGLCRKPACAEAYENHEGRAK